MRTRKEFEGYTNYGDVNYMDYDGCFIKKLSDTEYHIVQIENLSVYGDMTGWLIADVTIDITDTWIDKDQVIRFCDLEDNYNNDEFAYAVVSYYGSINCGGNEIIIQGLKKAYSVLLDYLIVR